MKIVAESTVITVTGRQGQTKPLKHTTGRCAELHRRPRSPVGSLRLLRPHCCWTMLGTPSVRSSILVTVPLTQGRYDALVSFTYNEGVGRLQSSTLLRVLNLRQYTATAGQFGVWVKGGGAGAVLRSGREVVGVPTASFCVNLCHRSSGAPE